MPEIKDTQNIMDAALQAYGTLDELVFFAYSNGFLLDELPTVGREYTVDPNRGDNSINLFIIERQFTYNNAGVEASEFILANNEDVLIAKVDEKLKYK